MAETRKVTLDNGNNPYDVTSFHTIEVSVLHYGPLTQRNVEEPDIIKEIGVIGDFGNCQ